ncbi:MAG: peptide chain release factor 3, partial [Woeseiaceae bacterium]|nr:peptide chain release factor 3 [Woeseiaceae bacterium]
DEIESVLGIQCAPITWPIGMGRSLQGVYHLLQDRIYLYDRVGREKAAEIRMIDGLESDAAAAVLGDRIDEFREEVELVKGACPEFSVDDYLAARQTPVFFGSAIANFGVKELLDEFVRHAPPPLVHTTEQREVKPTEKDFSGFVFKIQANMDPGHRDRIAFLRICSGEYRRGIRALHVRSGKELKIPEAITFMAADRQHAETAYAGDIIGIHNHGTINIGDSFTQGEQLRFTGVPNFAPEIFRRAVLKDPLRLKALQKGLAQLCEEGATQLFKPMRNNDLILGAVGPLQFDVVSHRLRNEYNVECLFEPINVATARWVECDDPKMLSEFEKKAHDNLARDHGDYLVYVAPTRVNLSLTEERWPDIAFRKTREH